MLIVLPARFGGWLTLSRRLCEKGLNLLLNLGVLAARALDAFLIVIADAHRKREVLATFLAKIFVKRHRGVPCGVSLTIAIATIIPQITVFKLLAWSSIGSPDPSGCDKNGRKQLLCSL
jgi:hypothetical protein